MKHPLRERTYDQRLVEAAIKSIQSPEDTREQEFEPEILCSIVTLFATG